MDFKLMRFVLEEDSEKIICIFRKENDDEQEYKLGISFTDLKAFAEKKNLYKVQTWRKDYADYADLNYEAFLRWVRTISEPPQDKEPIELFLWLNKTLLLDVVSENQYNG